MSNVHNHRPVDLPPKLYIHTPPKEQLPGASAATNLDARIQEPTQHLKSDMKAQIGSTPTPLRGRQRAEAGAVRPSAETLSGTRGSNPTTPVARSVTAIPSSVASTDRTTATTNIFQTNLPADSAHPPPTGAAPRPPATARSAPPSTLTPIRQQGTPTLRLIFGDVKQLIKSKKGCLIYQSFTQAAPQLNATLTRILPRNAPPETRSQLVQQLQSALNGAGLMADEGHSTDAILENLQNTPELPSAVKEVAKEHILRVTSSPPSQSPRQPQASAPPPTGGPVNPSAPPRTGVAHWQQQGTTMRISSPLGTPGASMPPNYGGAPSIGAHHAQAAQGTFSPSAPPPTGGPGNPSAPPQTVLHLGQQIPAYGFQQTYLS